MRVNMIDINLNPTQKELKQFSLFQLLFCFLVSGWLYYKQGYHAAAIALIVISSLICLVGRVKPVLIRGLFLFLNFVAFPIGWVVSHVILFLVYYLLLTPVGFVMEIVGYDPLHRTINKNDASYWIKRSETKSSDSYFKQY